MLDGGTLTLRKGTISSSSFYAVSGESSSSWTYTTTGTVYQYGGTITGGVQCSGYTIGTNDSSVSTTAPVNTSTYQYGAKVGTLYFYDGKIAGNSSYGAISATKINTTTGYAINYSTVSPVQTATLTSAIYSVTTSGATQGATSLSNALNLAAASGSTITMLADDYSNDEISKSITFDLNGHKYTPSRGLNINAGYSVTINGTKSGSSIDGVIKNYGTLTINGGTYTTTDNNAVCNYSSSAVLTIKSGTFTSDGQSAVIVSQRKCHN